MSRTDWIELASKDNWPAARVRNVVKAIKEERVRKFGVYQMPPSNAPPKRMTREDGIFWLSQQAKIPLDQFKMTRPVQFLAKYFLDSKLEDNAERANKKAIEIVHGAIGGRQYATADKDCASDWVIEFGRKQYLVEHACTCFALGRECECDHAQEAQMARGDLAAAPPAPPAPAPPAPAAADDVNTYVEGYDAPPPVTPPPAEQQTPAAPGAPAPESRTAPRFTPEERARIDADDHLFEPPLPTIAEVAERLMSLRIRVDAHVAADQQRKFEDRAALNRLSDRLVSSEMELGLIDDALDHMHAGQQSPANVVGRLAKIIARITEMDL
jgi:hypothetical protein